jgi:hypothetical protein
MPLPSWSPRVVVSVSGALLAVYPIWTHPLQTVAGHPLSDVPKHVWSYWHAPTTVSTIPYTAFLNGPHGGLLLDPMALPALVLAPVAAVLSPAAAANLWVVLMLTAAGLGVAHLARKLGATEGGAAVSAALGIGSSPLLAYPVVCGVHERLGVALLPWLVAALIERSRTGRGGWLPALLLVPLALHSGVWAWVGVLLMGAGLALPRKVPLARFATPWFVALVALGLTFAVSRGWSADPLSLAPQPGRHGLFGPGGTVVRAASPMSLWWPAPPEFVEEGDLLMRGEHIGAVATVLALAGFWARRDRMAWWWLGVLGALLLWSLGPWPLGRLNWVYAVSVWVVPLLGAWPEPGQLTLPLVLLLSAVAGRVWCGIPRREARLVVAGALAVEAALALPPLQHSTNTVVEALWRGLPEPGVVATVPRAIPHRNLTSGLPFLAQLSHQQPILASVFPGVSRWDDWSVVAHGRADDGAMVVDCFRRGGVRWLGVGVELLGDEATVLVDNLTLAGAVEVRRSDAWVLLDLGLPPADAPGLPPFQPRGAAPVPTTWLPPAPLPVGTHTVDRTGDGCPVDRFSALEH